MAIDTPPLLHNLVDFGKVSESVAVTSLGDYPISFAGRGNITGVVLIYIISR